MATNVNDKPYEPSILEVFGEPAGAKALPENKAVETPVPDPKVLRENLSNKLGLFQQLKAGKYISEDEADKIACEVKGALAYLDELIGKKPSMNLSDETEEEIKL